MMERTARQLVGPFVAVLVAVLGVACSDARYLLGRVGGDSTSEGGATSTDASGGDAFGGAAGTGAFAGTGGDATGGAAGAAGTAGAQAIFPDGTFTAATLVEEIAGTLGSELDPALGAGGLELYLSSYVGGTYDLYVSVRTSLDEAWPAPTIISELSTSALEQTPELSADGLTLYFTSNRDSGLGGQRIWASTRSSRQLPWGEPVLVPFVSYGDEEISPTLTPNQLRIAFGGRRGSDQFDLYEATRASVDEPFGEPILLEALNSTVDDVDPAYYMGGLGMLYASRRVPLGILLETRRATLDAAFSDPVELTELHDVDELDPWVSSDGRYLLFGSRRADGEASRIYEASR